MLLLFVDAVRPRMRIDSPQTKRSIAQASINDFNLYYFIHAHKTSPSSKENSNLRSSKKGPNTTHWVMWRRWFIPGIGIALFLVLYISSNLFEILDIIIVIMNNFFYSLTEAFCEMNKVYSRHWHKIEILLYTLKIRLRENLPVILEFDREM